MPGVCWMKEGTTKGLRVILAVLCARGANEGVHSGVVLGWRWRGGVRQRRDPAAGDGRGGALGVLLCAAAR